MVKLSCTSEPQVVVALLGLEVVIDSFWTVTKAVWGRGRGKEGSPGQCSPSD
jgi:hypothetical protein